MHDSADSGITGADPAAETAAAQARRRNPAMAGFRRILPINALVTLIISGTTGALLLTRLPALWVWTWLALHTAGALFILVRGLPPPRQRRNTRLALPRRSEGRRLGTEGLRTGRSRGLPSQ